MKLWGGMFEARAAPDPHAQSFSSPLVVHDCLSLGSSVFLALVGLFTFGAPSGALKRHQEEARSE